MPSGKMSLCLMPLTLTLMLGLTVSIPPLSAGVIVLEGSDANGVHCSQPGEQTYANELLAGLKGSSTLPILVLKTSFTPACSIDSSPVPHAFAISLATATPAFNASNYSALYIMSPGGCCDDGRCCSYAWVTSGCQVTRRRSVRETRP